MGVGEGGILFDVVTYGSGLCTRDQRVDEPRALALTRLGYTAAESRLLHPITHAFFDWLRYSLLLKVSSEAVCPC